MKPPPRIRNKRNLDLKHEQETRDKALSVSGKWQRPEQRKLLTALKTLSRKIEGHRDIDYSFLKKEVPTRSISEIHDAVEYLKKKLICSVKSKLMRKMLEDKKIRRPIEVWTHMASAVVGTLEEPISAAFTQMLLISSTEPRTLRNCDLSQVPTDADRPVGSNFPCSPVQGESPGTSTTQPNMLFKTPAPTIGPAKRISLPFKVVKVSNSGIQNSPQQQPSTTAGTSPAATCSSPNAIISCSSGRAEMTPTSCSADGEKTLNVDCSVKQTPQELSMQLATTSSISTLKSTSSSPCTPLSSSGTSVSQLPTVTTPSSGSSSVSTTSSSFTSSVPSLSPSAAATHAKSSSTSKHAEKDKSPVDFEKIYRYLSVIHKPANKCHLTPMESAIILDLMMSLPEELPLLDCTKLHQHLIQMHQCLTSPAKSKMMKETLEDLKGGLSAPTSNPSGRGSNVTDSQQQTARTMDSSGDQEDAESQSSGGNNGDSQSGNVDGMEFCPPLNPFVVPLKLLMRNWL